MSTINAQTIINEVMAAHAVAPEEATSFISFRTSAKGLHRIRDCKENLQRFADMVRKNAAAFGGGLIREAKQKPAISWPANLISLFKQSIEDHDYQAALDIGDKLGSLFFVDNKGQAQMQVAPVPCEFEPRLSSVCNENGTYAVIFPQNMTSLSGASVKAKRSRNAQIDNVQTALSARTEFNLSEALDKQSYSPVDQVASRAQWIVEHGLCAEVIESRIVAHEIESIEAMATQDVAQVVAQAVATIAISEAMQGSETGELVTCEAGESEAHAVTVGSATWAPVPQYVPCPPDKTGFNDGPAPAFRGDDGGTDTPPPAEFLGDATPPVAEFLPIAPVYQLPEKQDDWNGAKYSADFAPNARQQIVIDAVQTALSEGKYYTSDVLARCIELLNIDQNTASMNFEMRVEGGIVGMDCYYARGYIDAKKARESSLKTFNEMALREGDDLGILVFTDYKRTTGVKITGVTESGFTFTGKRGINTVTGTGSADQLKCGIERAFTTGKRKTDYAAFIAAQAKRPAPTPPSVESQPMAPVAAFTPPVVETPDTLESFDDTGDGVSDALYEAVQSATIDHVQALTDAQLSKLYDHLENWNFHTENLRLQALRTGVQSLIDEVAEVIRLRDATGCGLSGPLYDRYMTACRAVWDYKPTDNEEKQAEDVPATHNESDPFPFAWPLGQKITSKSGRWSAYIYKWHDGKFCLEFKETSTSGVYLLVEYDTPKERMTALQALARAADAPTDTPPCGEPCHEPVAGVKPATPPAVDVNEWGPAIGERYIGAVEYAVQEANKRGDGFEYRTGENALMERRKLPAVTQASAATQTAPAAPTAPVATSTPGTPPAVSSEFKRVGNVRVDLGQMVAQGVRPESLIGLGVYYEGNMANPSGYGAITATDKSDFHGLTVGVTLESGVVWHAVRASEFKEGSFYLDTKMHGAPYMAELAARVAAIKANDSASEEIAATAHAMALIDLAAQYPQLKRAENTHAGGKLAAVNMRVLLKEAFKGVKFSVTSDYNSVRVNWTDGPSDKQVNEVIGRFDIGASDSQSDYFYTVSTAFSQLFGGVQYLSTRREVSDSLIQVAIDRLYSDRSEKPTVTDYRKCTGVFDWNSQNYENRQMREMLETLGK